jgi:Icc-related predicted phosphoesterase
MKIAVCSDLHLEFGDIDFTNDEGADVLVLSGDIMVAADFGRPDPYDIMLTSKEERMRNFLERCSMQFKHTVYVMGNHEHYNGDFKTSADILRRACSRHDNIYFLDKETVKIDDVTFIGGTLWTDMNREDPLTLHGIRSMMNDFRICNNSNREVNFKTYDANGEFTGFSTRIARLSPEDAVEDHRRMLDLIKTTIELRKSDDEKFVVCGHHAPSKLSTHPRYKDEVLMNGGYSSDLNEFIADRPQIRLWTHGHTHELFDYQVGETRVVCNPRGYIGYEASADTFKLKVVEV